MTFTWETNLDLADYLANLDVSDMVCDPEAYYRTAVGRAYYSAHKSVHDWLESNTNYVENSKHQSIHRDVILNIPIHIDAGTAPTIVRMLDQLRSHRGEADYNLLPLSPWTQQRALDRVSDARFLLTKLRASVPKT